MEEIDAFFLSSHHSFLNSNSSSIAFVTFGSLTSCMVFNAIAIQLEESQLHLGSSVVIWSWADFMQRHTGTWCHFSTEGFLGKYQGNRFVFVVERLAPKACRCITFKDSSELSLSFPRGRPYSLELRCTDKATWGNLAPLLHVQLLFNG